MRCRVSALLCALLVFALVFGAAAASAQPEAEETRLEAQLQDDGDADWTIVAVVPLDTEADAEEFEAFADEFEQGDRDIELGTTAFERAAEEASTASGREMAVTEPTRDSALIEETEDGEVVSRHGELRVSFTWESFARTDENGTMYVDDAFNTTDGTWLPGLDEGQVLVLRSPPGYGSPSDAPIGPEDQDLRWEGPQTFEPGYFQIIYPQTTGPATGVGLSTALVGAAVLLSGAALLLGLYLLWGRDERTPSGGDTAASGAEPATPSEANANGGSVSAEAAGAAAADEPNMELLSDEERVEHLLERNGGRMKQATIVKETNWSNAKVSQLLSSMEEDDRIDKLRIGRENLISLPGEGVGELDNDSTDD